MGNEREIETLVWNGTVANLTLMALGSSAPEILLSCIETIMKLEEEEKGELGPSTIVGSAAFNLLMITAVSIISVDEPKYIEDLGVFTVTSIYSIWAYVWLVIVLQVWTPKEVTSIEAWLTLAFCFLLIICAYGADKYRANRKKATQIETDVEELDREKQRMIAKAYLRKLAAQHGQTFVIECVTGGQAASKATAEEKEDIRKNFRTALDVETLDGVDINHLIMALEAENLIERIAYRRQAGPGSHKTFVKLKGTRQQLEHKVTASTLQNPDLGFKCLHYSVTESSGFVEVHIIKKVNQERLFYVRTLDDTATAPEDYEALNQMITMRKTEKEKVI